MGGKSDALYRCLLEDLCGDTSPASLALQSSFFKKNEDLTTPEADAAAIRKFISVNNRCESYRPREVMEWEYMVVGELKSLLYQFFFPTSVGHILDAVSVFEKAHAGPGASTGARGEDFFTKHFDSTLTYSSNASFLPSLYQRLACRSPFWRNAEILRQSVYGFEQVRGSSISTVPKNCDISRSICTEPSLNMFFQLGMGAVIRDRLRDWGLDLSSQPDVNRELARVGSIDGSFGTIDLASASDSLSLRLMQFLLPQEIFETLSSVRCTETKLPSGNWVPLHMISTMGNGYTSALQTVLFTCIILSVYRVMNLSPRKRTDGVHDNWGVFGDDMIVRREAYRNVVRILELLGFEVNTEKSFNEGQFRESCGGDYLAGVDIRGVYCKTLRTVGARFSLANRLVRWSAAHGKPLLSTITYLLESLPVTPVPFLESDDAGFKVPSEYFAGKGLPPTAYKRWKPHLPKIRVGDGFITAPDRAKVRHHFEWGLAMALLQGSLSDGVISLRVKDSEARYTRCRQRTGYWDAITRVAWESKTPGYQPIIRCTPEATPAEWLYWSSTVNDIVDQLRRSY